MVWADMKRRTTKANHQRAKDYILRGIDVCNDWLVFVNFQKWATTNGYKRGLVLDRINNNNGYSPDNCRFITNKENIRNGRAAKITISTAKRISELLREGKFTRSVIADICGCSKYIVADIARGRTWNDAK
jgi:hypothetical protein